MSQTIRSLLALAALAGALAPSLAAGQASKDDKPIDFKQFVPPVLPPLEALAPNSQLNSGVVGGAQTPYTTAPLYNSAPSSEAAPGLKLTIPTR